MFPKVLSSLNELIVFAGVIALASVSPGPDRHPGRNRSSFGRAHRPRVATSRCFSGRPWRRHSGSARVLIEHADRVRCARLSSALINVPGSSALRTGGRVRAGAVSVARRRWRARSALPPRRSSAAPRTLGSVVFLAALFPTSCTSTSRRPAIRGAVRHRSSWLPRPSRSLGPARCSAACCRHGAGAERHAHGADALRRAASWASAPGHSRQRCRAGDLVHQHGAGDSARRSRHCRPARRRRQR